MLELEQVTAIAKELAYARFGARRVEDVRVEPIADWTGADALDVMIVLRPSAVKILKKPGQASGMLDDLGERLGGMGERRFAYVGYATQEELDADDDPES